MKYRYDIDCLRGLSVLAVIFYHLQFRFLPGGYLGVDIFFVISGYLITSLILSEIKQDKFSLLNFYERRIRRLFPVLIVVLLSTFFLFQEIYLKDEIINLCKSIISTIFFYANFFFMESGSYFDPLNETQPLLHTWSLSIEEQFYLFYPLLTLFLFKKKNKLMIFTIFLTFISLSLSQFGGNLKFHYPYVEKEFSFFSIPGFAFYFTFTRIWEILIGCIVSIYLFQSNKKFKSVLLSSTGYILIFLSLILFTKNTLHPSIITLFPILGVLLILIFNDDEFIFKGLFKIINNRIFLNVGLISYSLYLWHQPIYQFFKQIYFQEFSYLIKILIIIFMILISFLTYNFIEKPFRNKKKFNQSKIFIFYIFISCIIVAFSFNQIFLKDFSNKYSKNVLNIENYSKYYENNKFVCSTGANNYINPSKSCVLGNNKIPHVAFIGDSHMDLITLELEKLLNKKNYSAIQYTYGGCVPALGLKVFNDKRYKCNEYFQEVINDLKDRKNIKKVILFSRWSFNLKGERFDNQIGGKEIGQNRYHISLNENYIGEEEQRERKILEGIGRFISEISKLDKEIFIVFPTPEMGWEIPKNLARIMYFYNKVEEDTLSISKKVYLDRNKKIITFFKGIEKDYKIKTIDPVNIFCNENICKSHLNGKPLFFDDDHMSELGSKLLSEFIISKL